MAMAVSNDRVKDDVLHAPDQPSLPALKEGIGANGPSTHSQHNQQAPGTLLQRALARIMPGQHMQQHSQMQATAVEPLSGMLSVAAAAAAAAACCSSGQQSALPSFADQRELQLVAAAFAAGAAAGASGQFNGTIPLLDQLSSDGTSQTSSLAADGPGDVLPAAPAAAETSTEPNPSKLKPSATKRGDAFKSTYRGVFWDRKNSRWRAQVGHQNRKIFMGYFAEPADAARAYDKKLVQLRGTMAKTNFPLQDYAADLRLHKELRAAEDGDELLLLPLEELQAHLQQHLQERVPQQPALQKVYSDWSRCKAQTEALSLCARERLQLQQSGLPLGDQAVVIAQQQQQGRVRPFEQPQHQQQHLQSLQQHWGAEAAAAAGAEAASAPALLAAGGGVEQMQVLEVSAGGGTAQAAGGVQLPSALELQWSTSLPVQQQQQPRLRQQQQQQRGLPQAALTSQQQQQQQEEDDDPMDVDPILPAAPHVSQADVRPAAPQQLQLQQRSSRHASPTTPGGSSRSSAAAPGGSSSSGAHRQQREAPTSLQQHLLTRLHEQRVQRTSSGSSMEVLLAAAAALQEEEEVAATLCGQLHELVSTTAGPLAAPQQPCSRGDCVPLLAAAAAAAAAACDAEVSTAPAGGRQAASRRGCCQLSCGQKELMTLPAAAAAAAAASSGGSPGRGGAGSSGQEEASVGHTCLQQACGSKGSHSQHSVVVTDTAAVVAAILTSPTALQQQKHHSGSVWQHSEQQATGAHQQQQQQQEADSRAPKAQQQQDTASGQQQGGTAGPTHAEQQTREACEAPAISSGKTATLHAAPAAAAAGTAVSDASQLCMAAAAAAAAPKPGSSGEQQPQQVVFDTEQEDGGQLSPLGVLHRQMLQVPTTEQEVIHTIQMAQRAGLNKEGQQLLLLVMYHQLLDLQKEQQQQTDSAQHSKQLQASQPRRLREQQPATQQQGDGAADCEGCQQGPQQQQAPSRTLPAEGCVVGDRMNQEQQMGQTGCRTKTAQQLARQDSLTLLQGPQDQQQQQQGPSLGGDPRAGGSPTAGSTEAAAGSPGQRAIKPRARKHAQFEALQHPIPEFNGGKDVNYEQRPGGAQDVLRQLERPAKQRHLDGSSSRAAQSQPKHVKML